MAETVTPAQRFEYVVSRLKRHAEDISMGAEELAAILISTSAQLLGQTDVKLHDVVATFIADYLAAKEKAAAKAAEPIVKPVSLVPAILPSSPRPG